MQAVLAQADCMCGAQYAIRHTKPHRGPEKGYSAEGDHPGALDPEIYSKSGAIPMLSLPSSEWRSLLQSTPCAMAIALELDICAQVPKLKGSVGLKI